MRNQSFDFPISKKNPKKLKNLLLVTKLETSIQNFANIKRLKSLKT